MQKAYSHITCISPPLFLSDSPTWRTTWFRPSSSPTSSSSASAASSTWASRVNKISREKKVGKTRVVVGLEEEKPLPKVWACCGLLLNKPFLFPPSPARIDVSLSGPRARPLKASLSLLPPPSPLWQKEERGGGKLGRSWGSSSCSSNQTDKLDHMFSLLSPSPQYRMLPRQISGNSWEREREEERKRGRQLFRSRLFPSIFPPGGDAA